MDSRDCDRRALRRLIRERAALPNHRFIGLGDWGDWVLPSDRKRHRPSNIIPELASCDDIDAAIVDYQAKTLAGAVPLDLVAVGNHEATIINRGHRNPVRRLCEKLGTTYGEYCGMLRYNMRAAGNTACVSLTILYHHGAWYGKNPIPPGAIDWANTTAEGWDMFLFGHNHRKGRVELSKLRAPRRGNVAVARAQHVVACGTHLRNYQHGPGRGPGYGEMKGHAPAPIGAPLIRWRVVDNASDS